MPATTAASAANRAMSAALTAIAAIAATLLPMAAPARADCGICAEWNTPEKPFALFGNTYYVGVKGLSAVLVASPDGHVLIDSALPESAPHIADSIRSLGLRIEDVKYILNSHAHADHAGGIAQLQRLSGAAVLAAPAGARALAAGRPVPEDPQAGDATPFAPVANVRAMRDGDVLRLGGLAITMHATPGHTPGGASWTWRSCEGARCADMVFADSLTLVSAPGYRFTDHPDVVAQYRYSAHVIEKLPCDVLVSAHPDFSDLWQRRAAGKLASPDACRAYAAQGREFTRARLASERN